MAESKEVLHVVVFPWLARGHLIPFFNLSKRFAQKGLKVSFLSTPRNILRLSKIPQHLTPFLTLVSFALPEIPNLPSDAESTSDVPFRTQPLLKHAFDLLEPSVTAFLESSRPDWILHDYASHWLHRRAADLGVSRAFFSLFNAAWLSFIGPPSALIDGGRGRSLVEDFTVVPEWVPFESRVVYRVHEIARHTAREGDVEDLSLTPDTVRFGLAVAESEVVAVRSSREFEPEWIDLLGDIYRRRVFPVGFLPPVVEELDDGDVGEEEWGGIKEWLDKMRGNSVIYAAMGSESSLTPGELSELALGLELSELPFLWVLRNSPELNRNVLELLPDGFLERVGNRGMVYVGWAPQVRILSHDSVGGFLTHCGWNSVIEGLAFGLVLVLFPVANDQGINTRVLSEKGLGVEIPRNEFDGSFMSDSVAESVRSAMVESSGESFRVKAKEMKELFGNRNKNDSQLDEFIRYLKASRIRT